MNTRFGRVKARALAGLNVKAGTSIDALVALMADDLHAGRPVSLGIEAPLFLPVPRTTDGLSRGRDGEGGRSCFAPSGGYVSTLGLHELAYLLARLKERVPDLAATLDWTTWRLGSCVLVWEAFVSKAAHTTTGNHAEDAATAAVMFLDELDRGMTSDVTVRPPREVFSLAGAALLWTGLAKTLDELRRPTLVLRPSERWNGRIEPA